MLADENELLERTLSLHRQLNDAALAGADTHGIAQEVARLIERPVRVVRDVGKSRAWRYEPEMESVPSCVDVLDADGGEPASEQVEIRAGEERLGTIEVLGEEPVNAFHRNALEQGATIMALEMVKERAAWEAEWLTAWGVARGDPATAGRSERGAGSRGRRRLGVDLEARWNLAVIEPAAGTTADLSRSSERRCTAAPATAVYWWPSAEIGCSSPWPARPTPRPHSSSRCWPRRPAARPRSQA